MPLKCMTHAPLEVPFSHETPRLSIIPEEWMAADVYAAVVETKACLIGGRVTQLQRIAENAYGGGTCGLCGLGYRSLYRKP